MIHRALVPALLLLFLPAALSPAKPSPVFTNPRLAEILRLPALQPTDWRDLFSFAESGDPEAQYWLGKVYQEARLLPLDEEKAHFWLQKSASQGYAPAQFRLCAQKTMNDSSEADRCLWQAAEAGVPGAQFWLGVFLRDNRFGVTDEGSSLDWFRKAAEGGNPDAANELGRHYEEGNGVEQDYARAAFWYLRAAECVPDLGGAGQGRQHLGLLYLDGHGVPKDSIQAYMWFILAGHSKDFADVHFADVKSKMTPEQIAWAQQLAADWKKQHPDPAIY
jgi:TPR repeat protein